MKLSWFSHRFELQILLASSLVSMQTVWGQEVAVQTGTYLNLTSGTMLKVNNLSVQSGAAASVGSGASLFVSSSLANSGSFNTSTGSTVDFVGASAQSLTGVPTLSNLTESGGSTLTLNNPLSVNGTLALTSGRIALGSNTLTVGSSGLISGASGSSYVVTNSTGALTRNSVGAVSTFFPVGTVSSYNPVTITNAGTVDNFSARVQPTFDNAPPDPNRVVSRQWTITEAVAGGSNASIALQWNSSDQAAGFSTASPLVIGRYTGTQWSEASATLGGSGPYTASLSGITSFSPFAVGNSGALRQVILANLKALLEGPYNTGTLQMNKTLRTGGYLTTHFGAIPIPTEAVDSITIELRNAASAASATTRKYRPAWLLTDGAIRDFTDTTKNSVEYDTLAGNYFIVVYHRNHIPIMTAATQALNGSTSSAYDFTTAQTQAYGSNAMKQIGSVYAMIAGDANGNGQVATTDVNTIRPRIGQSGYNTADMNLNGQVQNSDMNTYTRPNLGRGSQVPATPTTIQKETNK